MALQFFAVHGEALAATHDALQRHASRHGLRPPGPTRALRIAQLYGHLQLRASGRSSLVLAVSELATCWRFQPRQLRQDLALLQALGWLSARGTTRGTVISLSGPEPRDSVGGDHEADSHSPEPEREECRGQSRLGGDSKRDDRDPAPFSALPLAPLPDQEATASQACPSGSAGPIVSAPSAASPAPAAPPSAAASDNTRDLLQRLAALYNQHRPSTWPAYQPRGNGLRSKLRQALKQAGSAEALADTLTAALRAMPSFWRHTYPQGRSGAECMAVLFCTDRGCAGLGVEFWHLFSWAQAAGQGAGEPAAITRAGSGPAGSASDDQTANPAEALQRARRLFLWDSGVWRSLGREALLLSLAEKREMALLLEASGVGIAGTAERQFAELEDVLPCAEVQPAASGEPGSSAEGDPAECLLGAGQVDDSHGSVPHSHGPGEEPSKPGPRALHRSQPDRSPLDEDLTPQARRSAPGAPVTPNPRTQPGPHREAAPPERRPPCQSRADRPIRSSHPATGP